MAPHYEVVVVGLGAMGASTLYQLAKRGVQACGIDRFSPPHSQGSSHGATRITRLSVGEGPAYVPLVTASHRIWRELERELDVPLFEACGVLVMTSTDDPGESDFTQSTIAIANNYGIPHEVLDASEIRARFPQFAPIRDDAVGYLEPSGGYVRPEACIDAQLTLAQRLGAEVKLGTDVTGIASENGKVVISTKDGTIVADRAIVSAGMWTADLLGDPFDRLLTVYRQKLYWFKVAEPSKFAATSPSFILIHGPTLEEASYGFPPVPGEGSMKIATHQHSTATLPEELDRQVSPWSATLCTKPMLMATFLGSLLKWWTPRCARTLSRLMAGSSSTSIRRLVVSLL
ncbi:putative sarcosine oxidase [Karstenula rhodostoma CBS 690.94]|uniref:Sarcosine oxidase n=1 Tax=Karstenula rhodostoma CBS 690.94 TaxID=1392251 RepID=A0A9P4UFG1_9PLEO|nr:putative sarcosine oxidase [Karstenula rhodostoma CBS 690.94]